MKHQLLEQLDYSLKGKEFSLTNSEGITHFVYPCEGCGGIMYHLYNDDDLILSIELESVEAINIARQMFNRVSGLPPMTKSNFVQFLIYLNNVAEEQSKVQQN